MTSETTEKIRVRPGLGRLNLGLDNYLYATGWVLRIILILTFVPQAQESLMVPFVQEFLAHPTLDPWAHWLDQAKSSQAFPFGIIMLLVHAPFVAVGQGIEVLLSSFGMELPAGRGAQIGFALSLLTFDYYLFRLINIWIGSDIAKNRRFGQPENMVSPFKLKRYLLIFYWLSPLTLFVNYIHGQADIVPTFFVVLSLVLLERGYFARAAFVLVIAFSAKASVLLVCPFIWIYVLHHPASRSLRIRWFAAFGIGVLALALSFMVVPGQVAMLLQNSELARAMQLGPALDANRTILIFPLIYGGVLAVLFFMSPVDRRSLYALLALALICVVSVINAIIGWYVWSLPFLLYSVFNSSRRFLSIVFAFWMTLILVDILNTGCVTTPILCSSASIVFAKNLLATAIVGFSLLIGYRMFRQLVENNAAYRMINRPIFIGIAGDSSTGKDTLMTALAQLVGYHRCTMILGDDYHRYARGAAMWKALTQLSPQANDLAKMTTDLQSLAKSKAVMMHHYDHSTGTFTKPRRIGPANLTIINGLHALYNPLTTELYDLSIFLKMDENLRCALKLSRDTTARGHTEKQVRDSIEARIPDGKIFIDPQAKNADIIFTVRPIQAGSDAAENIVGRTSDLNTDFQICLDTTFGFDLNLDPLTRALHVFSEIPSQIRVNSDTRNQTLTLYCSTLTEEDIAILATKLLSPSLELLAHNVEFAAGVQGVMQLIVLYALEEKIELSS